MPAMKALLRHTIVTMLAATAVGAACGAPQSPGHQPVMVGPGSSASPPTLPLEAPRNPSTNKIACGTRTCDATTEVCCSFGDDWGCAPRVSMPPAATPSQHAEPVVESCKRAVKSEYSFDFLATCDDSTDCPAGQVCCSQWLWSGAGMFECIPGPATGDSVCDYAERCAGDSCATRGTACVGGECRLANPRIKCGGVVCGKEAPVCCMRAFEGPATCERDCKPANEESQAFEFECSSSAGCPPGASCQAGMFGSFCAQMVDTANAVTLCESDADCPKDGCEWIGKKTPPVCKEGHSPGFTHCACD